MTPAPRVFQTLAERYDSAVFEPSGGPRRVRLTVGEDASWDALLVDGGAHVLPAAGDADATLTADARTWGAIAEDGRAGMRAYLSGRLEIRRNLHLGVGFLAATSGHEDPARLRFRTVATRRARLSTLEAGSGPPVVAVHGLGGTKGSFLPTVAALADGFRVIALDLPGFGDSDKPLAAAYDARYFAAVVVDLLDALDIECAHLIGNSLGGRVALEVGMRHPDRAGRLALLAPSLAWKRQRTLAPLLRIVRPELGLIQFTPRSIVETIVHRLIPGRRRRLGRGGRRRVPARLPHPCRQVRLLRGRTSHLSRGAQRQQRLLAEAGGAPGRCAVHLGTPRPARADRLRAACRRGAAGRPPSRARLRARPADRAAAGDARGDPRVPPVVSEQSKCRGAARDLASGRRALYVGRGRAVRREPHRPRNAPRVPRRAR